MAGVGAYPLLVQATLAEAFNLEKSGVAGDAALVLLRRALDEMEKASTTPFRWRASTQAWRSFFVCKHPGEKAPVAS